MVATAPVKADPEGKAGENSIPQKRVNAMMAEATAAADARAEVAEKEARLEKDRRLDMEARATPAAAPTPPQPEHQPLTRTAMRALVDEGKATQDEMDAELERQSEQRVEQRVASAQDVKGRAAQIDAKIDLYLQRVPDLNDKASDNHARVREEYAVLRKLEYPDDKSTELLALRAVLGDAEKITIPEEGNTERPIDTTTHGGGGGEGEAAGKKPAGPGPVKGVAEHFVEYWTDGIKEGRYSGWDDPNLQDVMKREAARGK
jgi:hypothetical protein